MIPHEVARTGHVSTAMHLCLKCPTPPVEVVPASFTNSMKCIFSFSSFYSSFCDHGLDHADSPISSVSLYGDSND